MKKINKVFLTVLAWGIVAILAGCSQAIPVGNLPQEITVGIDGSHSNNGNEVKQESEALNQGEQKEGEGAFSFLYEGVTLIPGEVFEQSALGKYSAVSEVPSCAFDGNDRVYNYKKFELTAYIDEKEERIYSIYFIDPNLPTTEGLCLGDTVGDMKSLYGEDYEVVGTSYAYTRGDTILSIITQNDVVVGIEYRLNR
ncbi:MAG: hypothetical protein J1E64_10020 [Acetatifactor sp.]|nr:hypothetical protein [Acetatifactor sp.]